MATISLEGVRKRYPNGFEAVKGIDLEVSEGEFVVLVGPSGCGKTTLLRMVAGLEEITAGVLRIGGSRHERGSAEEPRHRDGLPELRALPAHDRRREHRLRPQAAQAPEGRDRRRVSTTPPASWA